MYGYHQIINAQIDRFNADSGDIHGYIEQIDTGA
jgi:hypothetical protein